MSLPTPAGPAVAKTILELAKDNDLPPIQETEALWRRELEISGGHWNQLYPYQLLVVEQSADGRYLQKQASGGTWKYTLAIPPSALSIDMPFATQTHVTMGGIVEEHSGAPLRMISLSGTTGVLFGREQETAAPKFSFLESVFAGTIAQANNTRTAARTALNKTKFESHSIPQSKFEDANDMAKMTGYYQWRLLAYFFEAYAELKRTKAGRSSRLAFVMAKDESVYLVSPLDFQVQRSASSPLEYNYSIQFKGYKRIKLSGGTAEAIQPYTPIQRDPNKLASFLNKVQEARQVLQDARKTILAIGGDVEASLFTPLRECCLFVKDALSVPLSVADLSDSIIQNTRDAIITLKSTGSAVANFPQNLNRAAARSTANTTEIETAIGALAAEQGDDPKKLLSREAHPANSPFMNPSENFGFFNNVNLGDLHLPPAVSASIARERERVRLMTRLDFQKRRDAIAATATAFANAVGLGSSRYNSTYMVQAPAHLSVAVATDEDWQVLYALNNTVTELNRMVASGGDNDRSAKLTAISAVAGLAARSGIAFTTPVSKFAVPFPYASTLEMVSLRYLGTPDRWLELAALNGLQAPYVDEVGFELSLLVNGADNRVFVSDATNLFVGQPCWLSSAATMREQRRITKIDRLSPTNVMVTVDGLPDLDKYGTLAHATLQAFLPNTVNSQQTIYIPSQIEPKSSDFQTLAIPGIDEFDKLISVGGVDLLLTPLNDLVIGSDGSTKWSVGLTNITQKIRIASSTKTGTLLHHPDFGLPIEAGMSIADLSVTDLAKAVNALFAGDPSFAGVVAQSVSLEGGAARLNIAVSIAGSSTVIPVSAQIA